GCLWLTTGRTLAWANPRFRRQPRRGLSEACRVLVAGLGMFVVRRWGLVGCCLWGWFGLHGFDGGLYVGFGWGHDICVVVICVVVICVVVICVVVICVVVGLLVVLGVGLLAWVCRCCCLGLGSLSGG